MRKLILTAAFQVFFGGAALASSPPPVITPIGVAQGGLSGLRYALDPSLLGSPAGTMTSYVAGDTIALACPGVTFATPPVIGVAAVTSGAVTGSTIVNPGVTYGPPPAAIVTCSQSSTSGGGAGYQVSVGFGLIAAYLMPASLSTGGAANNGDLYLNVGPNDGAAPRSAGAENTYLGDKAGYAFLGWGSYNTAVGHNACGDANGAGFVGASNTYWNVCVGTDAGRNYQSDSNGYNVLIGGGAGRNIAAGWNVIIGGGAAGSSGTNSPGSVTSYNTVAIGFNAGIALTSGSGNTLLGTKVGSGITTGSNNLIMEATGGADNCGASNTQNYIALCAGSTAVISATGTGSPSTAATRVSGTINTNGFTVAALPAGAQGMRAFVTDATACTFLGSLTGGGSTFCPAVYNGSAWVAE